MEINNLKQFAVTKEKNQDIVFLSTVLKTSQILEMFKDKFSL